MNSNKFQIGLCMAGAVSAGAYTAGVMDYLIEALEEWQRRKDNNVPDTPSHDVEIPIIGGASAGGMMSVLSAAALHDNIPPVKQLSGNLLDPILDNKFYNSWVDLISNDMLSLLLDTSDIKKYNIESLLNSNFIDAIADKSIKVSNNPAVDRKYIAKNLRILVTLSNLKGMDYTITFKYNNPIPNKYIITTHGDCACFMLVDNEAEYLKDGFIPLNFQNGLNLSVAKDAAMATGAFPVGLKARTLNREGQYLNDLPWLNYITQKSSNPFGLNYNSLNIDGGLINNEPFDYIRMVLNETSKQKEYKTYQDHNTFNNTILMIDPFPSASSDFEGTTSLSSVVKNTLSAMIDQSRIKSSNLADGFDNDLYGQFLITPVRYKEDGGTVEGAKAIACGALGGFSGFISKEFRIHDYFLGRANCEKFLRRHFTVPRDTTNPIFVDGYAKLDEEAKRKFTSVRGEGLQIIPIFSDEPTSPRDFYMPSFSNGKKWPTVTESLIESYDDQLQKRIKKIINEFSDLGWKDRFLLSIGELAFLNRKIRSSVKSTIVESLRKNDLIQ